MKIKAGKYTFAFTLISCGILMLVQNFNGESINIISDFWMYSPAVLILFGLEIITLSFIYRNREDVKVEASVGSVILIILLIAFFMTWTNNVEIHDPLRDIRIDLDF